MSTAQNARRRLGPFGRRGLKRADGSMSLVQHLTELRTRLVISAVAFVALSVGAFVFFEPILDVLLRPLCSIDADKLGPQGCRLIFHGVMEAFTVRLKVTAMVGIAVSSPIWLYQLWAYVVPALSNKERHYALPFLFSTIALLLVGAGFAYLTLPMGLNFLISIGGSDLVPLLGADTYLNFIGLLLIGFGVAFELPLLVFFLGLAGVISVSQLRAKRRLAIVLVVALAAVVTPSQDPYTMLALAVPLYLFYEAAIFALSVVARRRAKAEEANAMKMSDDEEEVAQR